MPSLQGFVGFGLRRRTSGFGTSATKSDGAKEVSPAEVSGRKRAYTEPALLASRPEDSHLRALLEPYVVRRLLPSPVGPRPRLNDAAPSVRPHYRALIPTTSCSAPLLRFGTLDLAVGAAWSSPLASERQVLAFRARAWVSFAPPTCRMPLGRASGIPRADPGGRVTPRFRHRLIRFRHSIGGSLALASLNRACVPTFPRRSPPSLLTTAARGGLRPAPDCRPRRALLHLSYSSAPPNLTVLVTHDPTRT
jgi:hypothetical protein